MTRRAMAAAVIAALALPVLALASMVAEAEWGLRQGTVIRVPITGYDPRDVLRGHYLRYRFAWNWQDGKRENYAVALCVLTTADNPVVRPLPREDDPTCPLVLRGDVGRAGSFMPAGVSGELFVPEERAQALEAALRSGRSGVTIDLVVRRDGTARIKGWQTSDGTGRRMDLPTR